MRPLRAEVKIIPSLRTIAAAVNSELNFTVQHVADFLAGIDDIAVAATAGRDMMDIPLQQKVV